MTTVITHAVQQLKPKFRGWIHAGAAPLVLAAGIVLIAIAPPVAGKVASAIFTLTALSLFGTSAVYHRGSGRMRTQVTAVLKRIDHANIFLIIAGTYTPLAVLMLPTRTATILLAIVWGGALLGLLAHMFWMTAPRWVYVPVYIALGWVAIAYMHDFNTYGGPAVVWLIVGGGIAYTVGAVIYGLKRPNPSPRWFGFHEIFHALTVLGFAAHTVAIFIAAVHAR
jgi:hemolysin III